MRGGMIAPTLASALLVTICSLGVLRAADAPAPATPTAPAAATPAAPPAATPPPRTPDEVRKDLQKVSNQLYAKRLKLMDSDPELKKMDQRMKELDKQRTALIAEEEARVAAVDPEFKAGQEKQQALQKELEALITAANHPPAPHMGAVPAGMAKPAPKPADKPAEKPTDK